MRYEKPIVNVIDLQIKENIAAVDTTVYKGATLGAALDNGTYARNVALTEANTGISSTVAGGSLVDPS